MKVRVIERPDESVIMIVPAIKDKKAGKRYNETDDQASGRLIAKTLKKHPTLKDLPSITLNMDDLPERARIDAQGDPCPCRAAWRISGQKVVIDDTKIPPNYGEVYGRVLKILSPSKQMQISDKLSLLKAATENRDSATILAFVNFVKALSILTPAEEFDLDLTISEKRIA